MKTLSRWSDGCGSLIQNHLEESCIVKKNMAAASQLGPVVALAKAIVKTLKSGHKLLIFGNGGSAADAQHFAAELVVKYQEPRKALAAIALTTDTSVLTACGNDFHFDQIFARQVEALGQKGDMAIGISTSGKSDNVWAGLGQAHALGLTTVLMTGTHTHPSPAFVINVPSTVTAHIQETHIAIIHAICGYVDAALRGDE